MRPEVEQFVRVAKRINQAVGYLELGMARQALGSLEGLGPLGPFEGGVELLRAQAFEMLGDRQAATDRLRVAAAKLPAPHDRAVWLALADLYRQAGDPDQAIDSLARARGARFPGQNRRPG